MQSCVVCEVHAVLTMVYDVKLHHNQLPLLLDDEHNLPFGGLGVRGYFNTSFVLDEFSSERETCDNKFQK